MDDLPAWVAQYVGVPFLDHGRDPQGWDCYGVVHYVLRTHFGIEIPSYAEAYHTTTDRDEIAALLRDEIRTPWRPVNLAEARPGDALVFRIEGAVGHVALLIAPGRFLHVDRQIATVIDRLDHPRWTRRLCGVYRYGTD